MKVAPTVEITGQSLRTLPDADLLQLLLREDLPPYLTTMYAGEADRRMGKITPELCVHSPICDQAVTR